MPYMFVRMSYFTVLIGPAPMHRNFKIQEAQLMLTTGSTRLAVNQGQQT